MPGRHLLQRNARTDSNSNFALDLGFLNPNTYCLSLHRIARGYQINHVSIFGQIDTADQTSKPVLIESATSTSHIRHIIFSVGPTNGGDGSTHYYADGTSTIASRDFAWTLSIEPARTLPVIVFNPFRKAAYAARDRFNRARGF